LRHHEFWTLIGTCLFAATSLQANTTCAEQLHGAPGKTGQQSVTQLMTKASYATSCGRWKEAIGLCDAVLKLESTCAAARAIRFIASHSLNPNITTKDFQLAKQCPIRSAADYAAVGRANLVFHDEVSAGRMINHAIQLEPNEAQFYFYRSELYGHQKHSTEAKLDCDRVLRLNKQFIPAYVREAELLEAKGDKTAALKLCNQAAAIDPCPYVLSERAKLLVSMHRYKEALQDWSRVMDTEPNEKTAMSLLFQYRALNQPEKALAVWQKYASLVGDSPGAHLVKANLLDELRKYMPALNELRVARDLHYAHGHWQQMGLSASVETKWNDSDLRTYWQTRSDCFTALNRPDVSESIRQMLLQTHNIRLAPPVITGSAKGSDESTSESYKKSLDSAIKEANAEIHLTRAEVLYASFEAKQALIELNRALDICDQLYSGYIDRGYAYRELKNDAEALNDFRRAEKMAPNFLPAYFLEAHALAALGQKEKAMAVCDKLLALCDKFDGPKDMVLTLHADLALSTNRPQVTINDLDEAAKLCTPGLTRNLLKAKAYAKLGDHNKALEVLSDVSTNRTLADTAGAKEYRELTDVFNFRASMYDKLSKPELAAKERAAAKLTAKSLFDDTVFFGTKAK
jgi:tetratricopeptide (TPR) repeat protein